MMEPFSLDIDFGSLHKQAQPVSCDVVTAVRPILVQDQDDKTHFYLLWSSSTNDNYTKCPRLSFYRTIVRRQPRRSTSAMSYGQAIHKALELRYNYGQSELVFQRQLEVLQEHFMANPVDPMEFRNFDTAIECIKRYNKLYQFDPIKPVERDGKRLVEQAFALPIVTFTIGKVLKLDGIDYQVDKITVVYRGIIDVIASIDGPNWIVDHKTTSMAGPGFFNEFRLSSQVIGYKWAAKQLFDIDCYGTLINAIICRKPTQKGSGTPFEFSRERYVHTDEHVKEWLKDLTEITQSYVDRLFTKAWPKYTSSCNGKYGACEYFNTCNLPASSRAMDLASSEFEDVLIVVDKSVLKLEDASQVRLPNSTQLTLDQIPLENAH